MDSTVHFTRWLPTEENEHEVVAAMQAIYPDEGAEAVVAYVRKNYLKGERTQFVSAAGNVLMAKLLLLTGDTNGFHEFEQAAHECNCTERDRRMLSQMHTAWKLLTQGIIMRWFTPKWRLKYAELRLQREYMLTA